MLSEDELRQRLVAAAGSVADDQERAPRAIRDGRRRQRQRQQRSAAGLAVAVSALAVAGTVVITRDDSGAVTPASVAVISCEPGRTVALTPVVSTSRYGTVVAITNTTAYSVRVHLGRELAVVPPGLTEGQFMLGSGRHDVQCVSAGGVTPAVGMSVVPIAAPRR
jgi:hypothetical protein